MSKKLLNESTRCVDEALEGLVALHPSLRLIPDQRVVIREDYKSLHRVAIISGGGSGHEPFCGGYVGRGMLTAAVAGHVFASPPPDHILTGIREVGEGNAAGVLVMVLNYTGDRLNFGLSQQKARSLGIKSEMFISMDDCAQIQSKSRTGRRGLCGTLFLFKIAGAMSELGHSLEDILHTVQTVSKDIGTLGVSLSACSLPGSGPMFSMKNDEIEMGLGVHGEAGVTKIKMCTAKEVVNRMLHHMRESSSPFRLDLKPGDEVALLINNLGGTSQLEQLVVARELIFQLETDGVRVVRAYSGMCMTSLEMQGIQFSILKLQNNIQILSYLDAPTNAPAWPQCLPLDRATPALLVSSKNVIKEENAETDETLQLTPAAASTAENILKIVCEQLLSKEQLLNEYDSGSGDGDCGSTLANGVRGLQDKISKGQAKFSQPRQILRVIASSAENRMGGASGAIYSILFTTMANSLHINQPSAWCDALKKGTHAVMQYGGAQPGDRTMLDALIPAADALDQKIKEGVTCVKTLVSVMKEEAERGAASTLEMDPKAGRASTVSADRLTHPDPGATSVAACLQAIHAGLQ